MNKLKQLCMKTAVLSTILCTATSLNSSAQVYVNDYTSLHVDPDKKQWVEQHAIYRDDNEKAYYIAQGLRPRDSKQTYLGITKCDKDMNVISVWEYFNEPKEMTIRTETIDEMEGYNALILVGHYSNHSNINNAFVMSVDKYSGAVNWFKWFPYEGLKLTSLVAEKEYVLVTGERPFKYGEGIFKYSASAGIIMRLDKNGDLVWEREFEDDKYGYNTDYDVKQVFNSMNDIKRLDDKYFIAVGSTNNWVYKEQPQNLWDVDGMMTLITEDGDINYAYMLGNILPMSSNGQQSIQYELLQHVTVDRNDKTVVMVGERLEHPQDKISDQSPTPKAWGLWATKFDPYNQYSVWSYRYQYKDEYYRISDPEVEHDERSQYGISYNFPKYNAMAMKLDYYGNVMYHRNHYVSGMNGSRSFNDITHAFEYTNMTLVGQIEPDIDQYRSSYGWNVQAFDNILEKCEMENYKIEPQKAPYEIDKVEYRKYKVELVDEPIKEDKIKLENKVICKKQEVWFKQSNTGGPTSSVSQNTEGTSVNIRINGSSLMQQNTGGTYNAVLINALGQRMLETGNFTEHFNLNISGLPAGIYFLQVTGADMHESHTILVR